MWTILALESLLLLHPEDIDVVFWYIFAQLTYAPEGVKHLIKLKHDVLHRLNYFYCRVFFYFVINLQKGNWVCLYVVLKWEKKIY